MFERIEYTVERIDGVLYSMPISDILAFVIAFYFITKTLKSLRSEELDYRTHLPKKCLGFIRIQVCGSIMCVFLF